METRTIGDLTVSVAGLGTNNFNMRTDRERSGAIVRAALDAGVTFFDTADLYGGGASEEWLGEEVAHCRDDVVIATKFGWIPSSGPDAAGEAVEQSLRRLGTDHLDLLYVHRPDPTRSVDDVLASVGALVDEGKVREVGYSNASAAELHEGLAAAERVGTRPFAAVEDQYNLLFRGPERELIPACVTAGVSFVPFFPLASGLLTGKYRIGERPPADTRLGWALDGPGWFASEPRKATTDPREALEVAVNWHPHEPQELDLSVVESLQDFARASGRSMVELALGWLLAQPGVPSVIAGATSVEQLHQNVAATNVRLNADELAELGRITARSARAQG
jgi:aryl-alcohol dehydrogenase-like predicted oxidoreductase